MTATDATTNADATTADRELVITRVFDAPRDLVFRAWTEPEHVARWWGPRFFTSVVHELDVRPGGAMRLDMIDPNGAVYPMTATFREVAPPERLVCVSRAFEDEQGNAKLEVLNTVTFEEHEGKTRLTMRAVVVTATPEVAGALAGMEMGWSQSFDKLADYLATV